MACCGPHVHLQKTLLQTVQSGRECTCIQCFFGGPTTYKIKTFTEADLTATGNFLRDNKKVLYVHAPYVINLAHYTDMTAAAVTDKGIEMVRNGQGALSKITETLAKVDPDLTGTVLHIGTNGGKTELSREQGLHNVIQHLNEIRPAAVVYLENCAGEGTKLGRNMQELSTLRGDVDDLRKMREKMDTRNIGFCLDTQHTFASGACDMSNTDAVVRWFNQIDSDLSGMPVMFHLNDSNVAFNSHVDNHRPVGQGYIWGRDRDSLVEFYRQSKHRNQDVVLETPIEDPGLQVPTNVEFTDWSRIGPTSTSLELLTAKLDLDE